MAVDGETAFSAWAAAEVAVGSFDSSRTSLAAASCRPRFGTLVSVFGVAMSAGVADAESGSTAVGAAARAFRACRTGVFTSAEAPASPSASDQYWGPPAPASPRLAAAEGAVIEAAMEASVRSDVGSSLADDGPRLNR